MSIPADDNTDTGLSDADAIAALTGALKGPQASTETDEDDEEGDGDQNLDPEEDGDDDQNPDDEDEDDEGSDSDGENDTDQNQSAAAPEVSDETVVKVTVDGAEQELSIGSLKRLAGQEASLTRKSQEADVVGQRAAATLQGALETVLEDLQPYEGVDWVLEGHRMDPDEFAWHREQFTKLTSRRDKIIGNAQNLEATTQERREAQLQEQAAEAVRVLSDPITGIPGWSDKLYDDILTFAVEAGLPEDDVATIVNPNVIKIINDARLYRTGQKAAAEKVNLSPSKVRKGGGREPIQAQDVKVQKRLESKLKSGTATDDDAMAALMGRWGVQRRK